MVFTDQYNGYICGNPYGQSNCSGKNIQRTMDGGKTWVPMDIGHTSASGKPQNLFFLDYLTGWVTGGQYSNSYKTTDGGVTWSEQNTFSSIEDIYFVNSNLGFAAGDRLIQRSLNGGSSWTTVYSNNNYDLQRLQFINQDTGFVVGYSGAILRTTNGGTSWQNTVSNNTYYRDLAFFNTQIGVVISGSEIWRTMDGGDNWITINYDPQINGYLSRIQTVNNTTLYISTDKGLLKSYDQGATWNLETNLENKGLSLFYFLNEKDGYTTFANGSISMTTDAGKSWNNLMSGLGTDEINNLHFKDFQTGIIVDEDGGSFYTENTGISWKRSSFNNTIELNKVRWINGESAVIAGDSGLVLKTYDRGANWTQIDVDTFGFSSDLMVLDTSHIYIVADSSMLLTSDDGGENWVSKYVNYGSYLRSVCFLNKDTGFVGGSNGILKTMDGGVSWQNKSIGLSGTMVDIAFTNDTFGYAMGSFGKLHHTYNGGDSWVPIYPNSGSFYGDEMQVEDDSTLYFARLYTVYGSQDSGKTVFSYSTACAGNNGSFNTVHFPEKGFGYSGGGYTSPYLIKTHRDTILDIYLQDSIYCTGQSMMVGFHATGFVLETINKDTVQIELSDAFGNFGNPQVIGEVLLAERNWSASGILPCTLPNISGNNFRVRAKFLTTPPTYGPDNGFDIQINNSVTPQLGIAATGNYCIGEPLTFQANYSGMGIQPSFNWSLDGTQLNLSPLADVLLLDSLSGSHTLKLETTSYLQCSSNLADSINFTIQAQPNAFAGFDTDICEGDSVQIGINGNLNPIWTPSLGLSDPLISNPYAKPDSTTVYFLTVENNGCFNHDTVSITVENIDLTVNVLSNSLESSQLNANYQWLDCNNSYAKILSATAQQYAPNSNGIYAVEINTGSCVDTSACIPWLSTGLKNSTENSLSVFPNPCFDNLNIVSGGRIAKIEIYDLKGLLIKETANKVVPVGELSQGMYLIKVFINEGIKIGTFVKN
jgi:photosystem II stability/assembly factor-like uncharacterized protein